MSVAVTYEKFSFSEMSVIEANYQIPRLKTVKNLKAKQN